MSDNSGLWLLAIGPAGATALYWALYRYYRNTDKSHAFERETSIEALLDSAKGLAELMALALFDDIARTKDLTSRLDRGIGKWAVAAYRRVQEAAHKPVSQEAMLTLVQESERLARGLVQLP